MADIKHLYIAVSNRAVPALHSWLIRDTPPKRQVPVSRLAAQNNMPAMPQFEPEAMEAAELSSKWPQRFAGRATVSNGPSNTPFM